MPKLKCLLPQASKVEMDINSVVPSLETARGWPKVRICSSTVQRPARWDQDHRGAEGHPRSLAQLL